MSRFTDSYKMQMFPEDIKEMEHEKEIEPVGYKMIHGLKVVKEKVQRPSDNGMNDFLIRLYKKYGKLFVIRLDNNPVIIDYMVSQETKDLIACRFKDIDERNTLECLFFQNNKLNGLYVKYNPKNNRIKIVKTYKDGIIV